MSISRYCCTYRLLLLYGLPAVCAEADFICGRLSLPHTSYPSITCGKTNTSRHTLNTNPRPCCRSHSDGRCALEQQTKKIYIYIYMHAKHIRHQSGVYMGKKCHKRKAPLARAGSQKQKERERAAAIYTPRVKHVPKAWGRGAGTWQTFPQQSRVLPQPYCTKYLYSWGPGV